MLVVGLIGWWYGAGWLQIGRRLLVRVGGVLDFFSISLLFKTLFSPFKQISVGRVQGSAQVQLRAWFDAQLSRVIGALVRLAVIIFGLMASLLLAIGGLLVLLIWPFVPVIPLLAIGIVLGGRL